MSKDNSTTTARIARLLRYAIEHENDPVELKTAWNKQAREALAEHIIRNDVCPICLTEGCTVEIAGVVMCKHCHNRR